MHLKNSFSLMLLAAFLTAAISVQYAWGNETSPSGGNNEDSSKKVSKELGEAFDAMKQYGYEKKEEFAAWADKRMAELDKKIADLQKKMDKAGAEAKKNWQSTLEALKEERQELGKNLDSLKKSGREAWEDMKWGFSAAFSKMEQAYEKAAERFRDKEEGKEMERSKESGSSEEGMKK